MANDERFLTGEEFDKARETLQKKLGMDGYDISEALGCGKNQPARWSRLGAPRYIALAINALLKGVKPWKPRGR